FELRCTFVVPLAYKNTPFPKQYTILSNKWGAVQRYAGGFLFAEDGVAALGGGQDALSLVWLGFITSLSWSQEENFNFHCF
ncbi:MAG: hypothetical protein KH108_09085, partial [Faecalibacterium prausnitzii]|nr:hypothetical protein [Faecalibacterium prausnitzii]